jgi:hypothetical protein
MIKEKNQCVNNKHNTHIIIRDAIHANHTERENGIQKDSANTQINAQSSNNISNMSNWNTMIDPFYHHTFHICEQRKPNKLCILLHIQIAQSQ